MHTLWFYDYFLTLADEVSDPSISAPDFIRRSENRLCGPGVEGSHWVGGSPGPPGSVELHSQYPSFFVVCPGISIYSPSAAARTLLTGIKNRYWPTWYLLWLFVGQRAPWSIRPPWVSPLRNSILVPRTHTIGEQLACRG